MRASPLKILMYICTELMASSLEDDKQNTGAKFDGPSVFVSSLNSPTFPTLCSQSPYLATGRFMLLHASLCLTRTAEARHSCTRSAPDRV